MIRVLTYQRLPLSRIHLVDAARSLEDEVEAEDSADDREESDGGAVAESPESHRIIPLPPLHLQVYMQCALRHPPPLHLEMRTSVDKEPHVPIVFYTFQTPQPTYVQQLPEDVCASTLRASFLDDLGISSSLINQDK